MKEQALASLGHARLLRPAQLRAALVANDRIKLVLSLLQAAQHRATSPAAATVDLAREIAATDIDRYEDVHWLRAVPNDAERDDDGIHVPGLARLRRRLREDLATMAAPLHEDGGRSEFDKRLAHWDKHLDAQGETLTGQELAQLTHAHKDRGDSVHMLVMDMHKALNRLAGELSEQVIGGAHAWDLAPDGRDAARVAAFMRGVQRTAPAKLDHPGLGTTATRDGDALLIQNDIGTNDAHVLVLKVNDSAITLTYSDLHLQRFEFFQRSLADAGAAWGEAQARQSDELNRGAAFHVGTATFAASDEAMLQRQLEEIGARIVFLIDWNRARKQLVPLVGKKLAIDVLAAAAKDGCGHMAWLRAGGARLAWGAMAAQPDADFRLGDQLTDVLSPEATLDVLLELLRICRRASESSQPTAFVADEANLLLARALAGRHRGFASLQEHAALCHTLAQALEDGARHGALRDVERARKLHRRAKQWERRADELVSRAREQAERQPRWRAFARLLESEDDIADALEEASFTMFAIADCEAGDWPHGLRDTLHGLARAVTQSVEDQVRMLQVAGALEPAAAAQDQNEFLDALWRMQQAEQSCDQLHRDFRLAAAHELRHAPQLVLANELAAALESASDAILKFGWHLRTHLLVRPGGAS